MVRKGALGFAVTAQAESSATDVLMRCETLDATADKTLHLLAKITVTTDVNTLCDASRSQTS
eukprot:5477679-Prorocentrum_lima.AAC.1